MEWGGGGKEVPHSIQSRKMSRKLLQTITRVNVCCNYLMLRDIYFLAVTDLLAKFSSYRSCLKQRSLHSLLHHLPFLLLVLIFSLIFFLENSAFLKLNIISGQSFILQISLQQSTKLCKKSLFGYDIKMRIFFRNEATVSHT